MVTDFGRLAVAAFALQFLANFAVADAAPVRKADNWGEANRQTMLAQIVDPLPRYDTQVPETSGEHAAKAAERYRMDKVKQPDKVRTGANSAGGSSSGS